MNSYTIYKHTSPGDWEEVNIAGGLLKYYHSTDAVIQIKIKLNSLSEPEIPMKLGDGVDSDKLFDRFFIKTSGESSGTVQIAVSKNSSTLDFIKGALVDITGKVDVSNENEILNKRNTTTVKTYGFSGVSSMTQRFSHTVPVGEEHLLKSVCITAGVNGGAALTLDDYVMLYSTYNVNPIKNVNNPKLELLLEAGQVVKGYTLLASDSISALILEN